MRAGSKPCLLSFYTINRQKLLHAAGGEVWPVEHIDFAMRTSARLAIRMKRPPCFSMKAACVS
ncbi:Hypothetical protein BIBO2_2609 [Brucella sp. BO2]|nr:Hypothetical protein BIBO2_2609 [Brucella sp. BO2]KEY04315.1 hypothetical protein IL59_0211075 [Brucella suis bv. 4 str. 40]